MLERSDAYEHQISTLTSQIEAAEESIKRLQTSLADLVQSKNEHENLLLANFARVLNEKKLKIRNQQRLLATSNVASGQGMTNLLSPYSIQMLPRGKLCAVVNYVSCSTG